MSVWVYGQVATGAIAGVVMDVQGAVVPEASVEVRNVDTGVGRVVKTGIEGRFRVGNLLPGRYEVRVEREGFQRVIQRVEVGVAQEAWVEIRLPVGAITESVVITGEEAPALEPTRTELSQGIVPVQMEGLPVRGRNFIDLTLLTPRVLQSDQSSRGSAQQVWGGQFIQLSFNGVRNQYNFLAVDGMDGTWHIANLLKTFYSLDAVREFRVVNGMFGAEYGRTMGGAVTVATRSGTNQVQGTAFYFVRHNKLDARDILTRREHFRFHQFGAAVGGPIRRDRVFYFGSYEGGRQRKAPQLTEAFVANVGAVNQVLRQLGVPEEDLGVKFEDDRDMALVRGDVSWGRHQILARYNVYSLRQENYQVGEISILGNPVSPNGGAKYDLRDHAVVGGVTSVLGAQWVNEAAFQFSSLFMSARAPKIPHVTLIVTGFADIGQGAVSMDLPYERRWQIRESVAYSGGGHQAKFGVDYNVIQTRSRIGTGRRWVVFPNLQNFLQLTPSLVQLYPDPPFVTAKWHLVGVFGQDQWRLGPRLTLNLGLRWDVEVVGGEVTVQTETDKNNVQPRVGLAYQMTPRTVLRMGFGVFHGNLFESYPGQIDGFGRVNFPPAFSEAYLRANPWARKYRPRRDVYYVVNVVGPAARQVFLDYMLRGIIPPPGGLGTLSISRPDMPNPYAMNWGVEIQREVGAGWVVELNYTGTRALKMPVFIDTNLMPAVAKLPNGKNDYQFPTRRYDPNFSTINILFPIGASIYHGGTVTVRRSFARRVGLVANYTFSKAIDNNQSPGTLFAPEDQHRIDLDRAVSADDLPHRFVLNLLVESPRTWPVWVRDVQVSAIVTAQSGRVHNVIVGRDVNRDGKPQTDRPGVLGRNTYRGPEYASVDVRIGRTLRVGERLRAQVTAEFFNLFNRVNVLYVNSVWGSEDLARPPQPDFGKPQRVAEARQIRLGLRFSW
jgi:hypothetical protein